MLRSSLQEMRNGKEDCRKVADWPHHHPRPHPPSMEEKGGSFIHQVAPQQQLIASLIPMSSRSSATAPK
jgi:hypothetical protein